MQEQLLKDFQTVYSDLFKATESYRNHAIELAQKQYEVNQLEAQLYADGKIDGKNKAIRDAQVAELMKAPLQDLHDLEIAERESSLALELVKLYVEYHRSILRIYELSEDKND